MKQEREELNMLVLSTTVSGALPFLFLQCKMQKRQKPQLLWIWKYTRENASQKVIFILNRIHFATWVVGVESTWDGMQTV